MPRSAPSGWRSVKVVPPPCTQATAAGLGTATCLAAPGVGPEGAGPGAAQASSRAQSMPDSTMAAPRTGGWKGREIMVPALSHDCGQGASSVPPGEA